MTRNFVPLRDNGIVKLVVTALLLVQAAFIRAESAEAAMDSSGTFTWSAELVSFDEASRTVTLKTRLDSRADKAILDELSQGDPINLSWTGINWGAGIAAVTRRDAEAPGKLVLPAELAGTQMERTYLVYTLPVPEGSVSRLRDLEQGDWVTGTSPRDSGSDPAVIEIRDYNDVD